MTQAPALAQMTRAELYGLAQDHNIAGRSRMAKADLLVAVRTAMRREKPSVGAAQPSAEPPEVVQGTEVAGEAVAETARETTSTKGESKDLKAGDKKVRGASPKKQKKPKKSKKSKKSGSKSKKSRKSKEGKKGRSKKSKKSGSKSKKSKKSKGSKKDRPKKSKNRRSKSTSGKGKSKKRK